MSTDYYYHSEVFCKHCGRGDDPTFIGRSSGGWCFALQTYPDRGITTLEEWEAMFPEGLILDDEGDAIAPERMSSIIRNRSWVGRPRPEVDHEFYNTEPGPNNLIRWRVGVNGCVGHGETWDLLK
jgi:hypothetical protein